MPFIDSILKHSSVSIIGMEKNCGKTVVLNYILSRLNSLQDRCLAVTSIGVDGEKTDAVTRTAKPEITLYPGMLFATSQSHYACRRLVSEICDLGEDSTSLGKVVIAKVLDKGKVMLSGPGDTPSLGRLIDRFVAIGGDLVLVDGALSRKSLASPSVTDAMVLCTGAALSLNIDELVSKTAHTYQMISLPVFESESQEQREDLEAKQSGIWEVRGNDTDTNHTPDTRIIPLGINSAVGIEKHRDKILNVQGALFFSGMITDKALEVLILCENVKEIVVRDFTRIFVSSLVYRRFVGRGGSISVLRGCKLEAICINPVSPTGYTLDGAKLAQKLTTATGLQVYDVKKL